jgi:hypothetical protein
LQLKRIGKLKLLAGEPASKNCKNYLQLRLRKQSKLAIAHFQSISFASIALPEIAGNCPTLYKKKYFQQFPARQCQAMLANDFEC